MATRQSAKSTSSVSKAQTAALQAQQAAKTELEKAELQARERMNILKQRARQNARQLIQKEKEENHLHNAKKEYASRQLAKKRLLAFTKKFNGRYEAGWVHKDICRRLEKFLRDVEEGKSPRLILCMPPRHGKSEIASKQFPAFVLGHNPHFEIIAASYAVSLPLGFSRKVRQKVRDDPIYKDMFPNTRINPEAEAAEGWETTAGGGYVPAGVGGSITGKGAHILIIDDPVKDAQEADSATIRETTWDWWGATAKTRLAPGGGVLVIQTRWHDDDLAGRLLLQQKELLEEAKQIEAQAHEILDSDKCTEEDRKEANESLQQAAELREEIDQWELVNYPALAEHDEYLTRDGDVREEKVPGATLLRKKGEALHPERFSRPRLMNMKRTLQPRHWSALYQQNPVPDEGLFFTGDLFRFRNELANNQREGEVRLLAVDLAIAEKQMNDRTSLAVGVYSWDGTVTVPEVIYGRWGTYGIVDTICNAIQRHDIDIVGLEHGQLKLAIMPILLDELAKREINVSFDDKLVPVTDKAARARPLQGYMQQGRWYYIRNDEWFPPVKTEMLRFPGGVFDDNVDSQSWLARMVANTTRPSKPQHLIKRESSWKDALRRRQLGLDGGDNIGYMGA